ncbi:hypothetical protein Skr01_71470 [Sphaerisporangium krabiense]|uniref:Cell division protein FtsL n=1 Tax=Sphaerisporangium krabiense TaxID=763782 RepID=A0A7W9DS91_9ACTN|nr:hypothetical protein [Sphaerisporangium krabiense]MBB5629288.1 hypothetical protein [Sphaerisporangium krabiense]GII67062.1 hypothetical protein Skr01_71470 [Sphaerisporangium krabiense]
MRNDEEHTTETGGGTATAVDDRPVRARGVAAPPSRPARAPRRAVPSRPARRGPAPASPAPAAARRPAAARPRHAPRTPFVLLVVGLLCGGLVTLLLLNTVLAQDSFRVSDLRDSTRELHEQAQDLNKELLRRSQPGAVADEARKRGVRPDNSAPEILDVPGGSVVGGQSQVEVPVP